MDHDTVAAIFRRNMTTLVHEAAARRPHRTRSVPTPRRATAPQDALVLLALSVPASVAASAR